MNMILRIQNLKTQLPKEQVMAEITNYSFLHRIRTLPCTTDYLELSKDLVQHNLDAWVASRPEALRVTLNRLKNTIALLEPNLEKMRGKVKTKLAHVLDSRDNENGENQQVDHVYSVDSRLKSSGRWWNHDCRFPCPILGHKHELTTCEPFFQMTPRERQESSRGRICKTCFKPGGECLVKDTKCGTKVPMSMLCPGCVAFTNRRRFSPHNVLFCNSKHPAHNKPHRRVDENSREIF